MKHVNALKSGSEKVWLLCSLMMCSFVFSSCVERIKFFTENRQEGLLVVDGSFTDGEGPQIVKLAQTVRNTSIPKALSGAGVRIYDRDLNVSEDYLEDRLDPGTYIFQGHKIKAETGKTYFLEVSLPDGTLYRSKAEEMPPHATGLVYIDYDFSVKEEINASNVITKSTYIDIFIDTEVQQADQQAFYLKWDVEEVYIVSPTDFPDPFGSIPPPCYVYVYPNSRSLRLFDGSNNQAQFLNQVHVASQKIGFEFLEKHYFSVYQQNMSREAFEYWRKIDQLLSNVGNIFDIPPAAVPGNIVNVNNREEEVLGYFGIYSQSYIRTFTTQSDIPVNLIPACEYNPAYSSLDYPERCINCLRLQNSTFERPSFF